MRIILMSSVEGDPATYTVSGAQIALDVNLVNAGAVGGGTQYAESVRVVGDSALDLIGTAMIAKQFVGGPTPWELRVPVVDNNDILKVALYDAPAAVTIEDGGNSITVDFGILTPSVNINNLPYDGQQTMANSLPVAIASDQSSVPVNLSAALPSGTNNIGDVDVLTMPGVAGSTAHDGGGGSVNPVAIGGYASATIPTAVSTDTDIVRAFLDYYGRLVTQQGVPTALLKTFTKQYTSQQTGDAMLTPTSGKIPVVTYYQIQVGGTTAGTMQLWYGGSGDTTYTRGTDRAIFDGEFAPSSTLKPGIVCSHPQGWPSASANDIVRVTTSAAINPITVTIWYYEL